ALVELALQTIHLLRQPIQAAFQPGESLLEVAALAAAAIVAVALAEYFAVCRGSASASFVVAAVAVLAIFLHPPGHPVGHRLFAAGQLCVNLLLLAVANQINRDVAARFLL